MNNHVDISGNRAGPSNSRRNNPYFCSEFKQVKSAVDELYTEYEAYIKDGKLQQGKGSYTVRKDDVAKIKRHIENLILDLYAVWKSDKTKFLGYSRDQGQFRKAPPKEDRPQSRKDKGWASYYDYFNKRPMLSKTFFIGVIDFLIEYDYVDPKLADSYKQSAAAGTPRATKSSRIRATNKLINLLHQHEVSWPAIQINPDMPFIVLRDEKKKHLPFDPDDHPEIKAMQANLREINRVLDWCHIDLNLPDDELEKLQKRMARKAKRDDEDAQDGDDVDDIEEGDDEEEYREPFDLTNKMLRRKFINDFNSAGRFYGGWWQGCPKEYRKHITINHKMTAELDYGTIQPHILYAKAGHPVPDDSYLVGDWDESLRDVFKKAFNQLVNSKPSTRDELDRLSPSINPATLPKGWEEMTKNERKPYRLQEFERLTGKTYETLLIDFIEYHKPIDEYFFSGAWKWLQRIDSDIAEKVMLKLILSGKKIAVLPIHDSFIAPIEEHRNNILITFEAMKEAYREVIGSGCKIDLKDFISADSYNATVFDVPDEHITYKQNSVDWINLRGGG